MEKKNDDVKRMLVNAKIAGVIATTTVSSIVTLPMSVYAEENIVEAPVEREEESVCIMSDNEVAAKEQIEVAKQEVETSKKNYENSINEKKKAEENLIQAQTARNEAKITVEEAEEMARKEFENVVISAEAEYETAKNNFYDAIEEQKSAEEVVKAAEAEYEEVVEEAEQAEEMLNDIENKLGIVTDEMIDAANTEKEQAEAEIKEAKKNLEEAEKEVELSKEQLDSNIKAVEEAKAILDNATREVEQAKVDVIQAESLVEEARNVLSALEEGYEDSEIYLQAKKEYEEACEMLENVQKILDENVLELENASVALENANEEVTVILKEIEKKQDAVTELENSLNELELEMEEKETAIEDVLAEAEMAEKNYEEAKNTRLGYEKAKAEADKTVEVAKTEKANADVKVVEAEKMLEDVQNNLETAKERYDQGFLGFINWMLNQEDLDEKTKKDLESALTVLENAQEESFTKWAGGEYVDLSADRDDKVIVIGDEKDATSLGNIRIALDMMEKINELRESDDNYTGEFKRNEAYTNFYFMAVAQAGAMRGAGLHRHSSLIVSCENLAFGYSDPTEGWYEEEKAYFDEIKADLGIETIMSQSDINAIKKEASKRGVVVGHYTNLMWSIDQVMGTGYTQYSRTSCYNASATSNYSEMYLYTIDEFKDLFEEYYKTVDTASLEKSLEQAEKALNDAKATAREKIQAIENAEKEVEKFAEEVEKAKEREDTAKSTCEEKLRIKEEKANELEQFQKCIAELQNKLVEAESAVLSESEKLQNAKNNVVSAEENVLNMQEVVEEATNNVKEAEELKSEKENAIVAFAQSIKEAEKSLEEKQKLLEEAKRLYTEKENSVSSMNDKLILLEQELEAAKNAHKSKLDFANKKEAILAEKKLQAESVFEKVNQYDNLVQARLQVVNAQNRVIQTKNGLDNAQEMLNAIIQKVSELKSIFENSLDKWERAKLLNYEKAKEEKISDSNFDYLNIIVENVKAKEDLLSEAIEMADYVKRYYEEKNAEYEHAQKEYLLAVAELSLAQDNYDQYTEMNESVSESTEFEKIFVTEKVDLSDNVKTGDTSNVKTYGWMVGLSGVVAVLVALKKRFTR